VRLRKYWRWLVVAGIAALVVGISAPTLLRLYSRAQSNSIDPIQRWFNDPSSRPGLATVMNGQACPGAPFILPSDGFIGLLWNDSAGPYTVLNTHSGIDIFGDGAPGSVPVYAAYAGYLTRLDDWLSSVIIRHDDPLQPGRTIWTYYTHMAARDGSQSYIVPQFPPGTFEQPVEQGVLLGYQGEYSGGRGLVGLHLHFSIVLSDANGAFTNQDRIVNTLDPSPYLGLPVNIADLPARPIRCGAS
jgi:hypothetical protein